MGTVKVTLRKREYASGKVSLYLDFYPAIRNPRTMQMTRREYLGTTTRIKSDRLKLSQNSAAGYWSTFHAFLAIAFKEGYLK